MRLVEITLFFVSLGLLVPAMVLFVECLAALLPARSYPMAVRAPRPRTDVVVPAHNEAAAIGACLASLRPQLSARDRLLVIADNCEEAG